MVNISNNPGNISGIPKSEDFDVLASILFRTIFQYITKHSLKLSELILYSEAKAYRRIAQRSIKIFRFL